MSQEAYKALYDDLVVAQQTANDLQRRLREVQAKEDKLAREGKSALDAGEERTALEAERADLLAALQRLLDRPRLGAEKKRLLKAQLTPAENAQLRRDMLKQLQAATPDMKDFLRSSVAQVMQGVRQKHGSTPETEERYAKVKKIFDEI